MNVGQARATSAGRRSRQRYRHPRLAIVRVFDHVFAGRPQHRRSQGGLGIGLSLVASWSSLHGGTVQARAPDWAGSEFTIRLPLEVAGETCAAASPNPGAPSTSHAVTLLIADDTIDAANAMADVMAMLGHQCSVA